MTKIIDLEQLTRPELSFIHYHAENLLYRGFIIQSVEVKANEKFFVATLKSYNDKRKVDRLRNFMFKTRTELKQFLDLLRQNYKFEITNFLGGDL